MGQAQTSDQFVTARIQDLSRGGLTFREVVQRVGRELEVRFKRSKQTAGRA